MKTLTSSTALETKTLGRQLALKLPARAIVTLTGPLGSGKTTFVQGFVASWSTAVVNSPTYVYHVRYQNSDISSQTPQNRNRTSKNGDPTSDLRLPSSDVIDHVDLYRVHTDESLRARSGIDELLTDVPGWLIIEWPLADLVYPPDIPIVHLTFSGAPAWAIYVTSNWPLDLVT